MLGGQLTRGPGVTRGPSRSPVTGSTPRGAGVLDPGRSTSTSSRSIFSCCGAVFEGGWLSAALWDGCFQGWGGLKNTPLPRFKSSVSEKKNY